MNLWLQITSGRGPVECCWVVSQVMQCVVKEARKQGMRAELLEGVEGEESQTLRSALLAVEGEDKILLPFLQSWEGSVQWIGKSFFRPHHKRKNWFVGVVGIHPPAKEEVSSKDFKFETMRASGAGGQHVNKSDTAVRATHIPSKLSTVAQEERSQHMNRKLALARMLVLLDEKSQQKKSQVQQDRWGEHNELERGNPIRIYEGKNFKKT